MSSIARPVSLRQTKYDLQIIDAAGECIAAVSRNAWSSSDKTLEDTIECRNFKDGAARERAAAANALQIAQMQEIVANINAGSAA